MSSVVPIAAPVARWPLLGWVVIAYAATLLLYRDTALHMASLWSASETYAHGYVVPLISAWLAWRRRADVAACAANAAPSAVALLPIAVAALAWLVGEAANVNALRHFALVAMLVFIVPAVVGWQIARVLAFPLGFLFFSVPFGDFLLPVLMEYTAQFVVVALRATGVPVYQDGLRLVIPSGTWSVVEACSGVRYLIASLMVGALFAYLHYRSTRRRLIFMGVAFLVPVVANWVRAYAIVMLGHLSDNTLAVGVDHFIYGWVFFGVVVGLMFFIGGRWSEMETTPPAPTALRVSDAQLPAWRQALVIGGAALLLSGPVGIAHRADRAVLSGIPKLHESSLLAALPPPGEELPAWEPDYSGEAARLHRTVNFNGRAAGVYIAYYRQQNARGKLLSSVNVLANSDSRWHVTSTTKRNVEISDEQASIARVTLRMRGTLDEQPQLVVWRTHWVDDHFESDPMIARLRAAVQRLAGRGDDAAVVILYTVDGSAADDTLGALLRQPLSTLRAQLRLTRDGD